MLSPDERAFLVGLLDQQIMSLINMSRHPDLDAIGRQHYRRMIDKANALRLKLENDRAAA